MIAGIGIDMISIERIEKALARFGTRFTARVFTSSEAEACEAKKSSKTASYAARFAAKEAVSKALGIGIRQGVNFSDIEVAVDSLGKPSIVLHGKAASVAEARDVKSIHVSLTHEEKCAVAFVIVEK